MKTLLFYLAIVFLPASATHKSPDALLGTWVTSGSKAKIQIYKNSAGKYAGKIAWLKVPLRDGKPKIDINNPNPKLRNQPIVGLEILRNFTYDGDNEWEDGTIYDPESGKTYSCKITMTNPKTIKVRGYIGVSLLGRTEVWTR